MADHDDVHGGALQQQGLTQQLPGQLALFWQSVMQEIEDPTNSIDFKSPGLPFARIKKIMKSDEDVRQMISAEAPVLFAKACELFILELTLRSWIHTEENKRKTLQRNDTAMAISKTDTFDFLIDIVPRDDIKPTKKLEDTAGRPQSGGIPPELQQYYFQLLQQQHQQQQQQQQQQQASMHAQPQPPTLAHTGVPGVYQPQMMSTRPPPSMDPMIMYQQQAAAQQQLQSFRLLQQAQLMSQLQMQQPQPHETDDQQDRQGF